MRDAFISAHVRVFECNASKRTHTCKCGHVEMTPLCIYINIRIEMKQKKEQSRIKIDIDCRCQVGCELRLSTDYACRI